VLDLRVDHDPQRRLLQVQQLRQHVGLRVGGRAGLQRPAPFVSSEHDTDTQADN
jgi:hypothetical protein